MDRHSALFAGSFDPPTLGHQDIIERGAAYFKKLYVGVAQSQSKLHPAFTMDERYYLLKKLFSKNEKVEVVLISGLVADFVQKNNIPVLLRSLRAFSDTDHEFQMALANKKLCGAETFFLLADPRFSHLSSTLIREIAIGGHHLKDFIPKEIEEEVSAHLKSNSATVKRA